MSIGILTRYVAEGRRDASGIESPRSTTKKSREMSEGVVLPAARDFFCLGMDGYETATRERANVRPASLVQGKIPASEGAAPVAKGAGNRVRPEYPVGRIRRAGIVWAALGPMHRDVRMRAVHLQHHVRRTDIAMPGYCT